MSVPAGMGIEEPPELADGGVDALTALTRLAQGRPAEERVLLIPLLHEQLAQAVDPVLHGGVQAYQRPPALPPAVKAVDEALGTVSCVSAGLWVASWQSVWCNTPRRSAATSA